MPCSGAYGFPCRPSFWAPPPLSRELLSWPMELGMAPSAFPRTSHAKGSPSTAYICSVHFSSLGACTRDNIVWRSTCYSSYLRAAYYYPSCRVLWLARFFPDFDHYSNDHIGEDGPEDSHSPWDSAAPRSFATSSTCSGTFHSCSGAPLLSTRGAYYLIIRSLLFLFYLYLYSIFLDVLYILDHFYTRIGCIPCLSCILYSLCLYRHLPFCVF